MDLLTLTTLTLLFPIFILLLIDFYHHNNKVGKSVDKIPGPRFFPLIGNGRDIFVPLDQFWDFFRINAKKFYPVFKIWVFNWPLINIWHPDDLEVLLSSQKNIKKSLFYDLLHPWLNDGLLTSSGEKWHKRRKILTPAFHFKILAEFVDSIVEHTDRTVAELRAEAESGEVVRELLPLSSKLTLGIICETAMGTKIDSGNKKENEYKSSIRRMAEIFYYRAVRPWLKSEWIFSLTPKGKEQADTLATLHGFTADIIKERQQYHDASDGKYLDQFSAEKSDECGVDPEMKKNRRRLALLDLLIAASRSDLGIDDRGIREEVDTFVFEGHDTTAIAFLFLTLLLAEHRDVQEKCRQEVEEIMKNCGGNLTMKDVQNLHYLERCIKETLRLYPSVPAVSRNITEDIQLKNCFVPAGTTVFLNFFDTHRDPNFWPHPDVFDPDRFLPERSRGRHPFAYVPFSAGPRNCIGQKFAMLELKIMMAGLLKNFCIEPVQLAANLQMVVDFVLRFNDPVQVKLVPIAK